MQTNPKYMGFSYEQASREGLKLLERGLQGNWHAVVDDLVQLRDLMLVLGKSES